jgi:Putative auto-transporter adhesin, head GIN domain
MAALYCSTFAQKNQIEGSGNVTTQSRTISSFKKIELDGVFKVQLKQGGEDAVQVEADDNLQDLITVSVANETLKVGMKKKINFKKSKKMIVHITFKDINEINNKLVGHLSGIGAITLDKLKYTSNAVGHTELDLKVTDLEMNLSSVGHTNLEGKVTTCNFTNSAVGNFDGSELVVENMKLNNSAVGNTTINAQNLNLKNSAIGKLTNKNKTAKKEASKANDDDDDTP